MHVSAVILAGGAATRMGGEKPLRVLRGMSLLQHSIERVAPLADEILVSAGARELEVPPPAVVVHDPPEYQGDGPLAGVLGGLRMAAHPKSIVTACDLPNVPSRLLAGLLNALEFADAAWCEHDGHPEPLIVALKTAPARDAIELALEHEQKKVMPVWESLPHYIFDEQALADLEPLEHVFANINTMEDLEREEGLS